MNPNKGRIIELPKIVDPRGNLTVAVQMKNIPFNIERVYWTYDIPGGEDGVIADLEKQGIALKK